MCPSICTTSVTQVVITHKVDGGTANSPRLVLMQGQLKYGNVPPHQELQQISRYASWMASIRKTDAINVVTIKNISRAIMGSKCISASILISNNLPTNLSILDSVNAEYDRRVTWNGKTIGRLVLSMVPGGHW